MKYKWSCGPIQTKPASLFWIGAPIGSNLWRQQYIEEAWLLVWFWFSCQFTIGRLLEGQTFCIHFLPHFFLPFFFLLLPSGKIFLTTASMRGNRGAKWMLLSKVQYNKRQNAKLQFSRNFLRCKKLLIKSPPKWRKYRNVSLNLGPEYIAPLDFLNKQLG